MDVGLLSQYIMNGLMLGMMYTLVAVGFTLFFGVLDIIKFSHGDVLTVGAFTGLATYIGLRSVGVSSTPLLLLAVLVVAILAMAALGMLIARYLVLPLRSAPALNTLLITLMLGTVLREMVRLFYPQGANPKPFPALLPTDSINLGQFNLRLDNAMMLATGVAIIVGLRLLLNRTKLGKAMRATFQDRDTAALMGVNIKGIYTATFAIGSGLAAAAGALLGPVFLVTPSMGDLASLKAFAIVILGGLGNITGATLGGFILAFVEEIGAGYISSGYRDAMGFLIIIIVLLFKPTGLFARAERIG